MLSLIINGDLSIIYLKTKHALTFPIYARNSTIHSG